MKLSGIYKDVATRVTTGITEDKLIDYINTIIDCGFVLKGIYEPAPIVEGKEENESLYELLTRIPNFIFIQAIKQER